MNYLNSTADSLKKKSCHSRCFTSMFIQGKMYFPKMVHICHLFLYACMKNSKSRCKNVVNNKCFSLMNLFLDLKIIASEQKELSLMTGYYFGFLVIIFSNIICLFTELPKSIHKNREFLIHWHY